MKKIKSPKPKSFLKKDKKKKHVKWFIYKKKKAV